MITLRALSALLTYPRRELLEALPQICAAIAGSALLGSAQKERLAQLVAQLQAADPFELEESYVGLFDTGRSTSLWLFEHVHGESRERGQAMVDLKNVYERAGLVLATNELPDYLPAVLEYLSCRELPEARDMLGDCAHILRTIGDRLAVRGSCYGAVFDALLHIAAEPGFDSSAVSAAAAAPPELISPVDDDWMEAPAFGHESQPCAESQRPTEEPGVRPVHFMPGKGRGAGVRQ